MTGGELHLKTEEMHFTCSKRWFSYFFFAKWKFLTFSVCFFCLCNSPDLKVIQFQMIPEISIKEQITLALVFLLTSLRMPLYPLVVNYTNTVALSSNKGLSDAKV